MTPEEAIKILEKKKEYSERITDNFLSHSRGEIKDANETIEMCKLLQREISWTRNRY